MLVEAVIVDVFGDHKPARVNFVSSDWGEFTCPFCGGEGGVLPGRLPQCWNVWCTASCPPDSPSADLARQWFVGEVRRWLQRRARRKRAQGTRATSKGTEP